MELLFSLRNLLLRLRGQLEVDIVGFSSVEKL